MTPSSVRNHFFSILSDAENDISSFVKHPGADMTRHRRCDFTKTVLATLSLSMNRTNTELSNFFGIKKAMIPSKSAFTQQRQKFNDTLFPFLIDAFRSKIPHKNTYKGFHLVAVDGSDLNLPTDKNDTVYRVKQARSNSYYYQMHLNAFYDICENRYLSVTTQPRSKMDENEAFCSMLDDCTMPENTIFIADRGYVSLNTFAHLIENNRYFLIRAKAPSSAGSILRHVIPENEICDQSVTFLISRSKKNLHPSFSEYSKLLRSDRKFDYIEKNDKTSVYRMTIRCTCIQLDNGSYEYLISNLPAEQISSSELKTLYWKRWSIETSFRSLKYALSLAYLHSVKRDLIIQEIYAKILLYNFTSLIHAFAQNSKELLERNKKTKYKYKVSFDDAVPVAKKLLKERIKNDIIKALLLSHLTKIKAAIQAPRHMKSQKVKTLNNRA